MVSECNKLWVRSGQTIYNVPPSLSRSTPFICHVNVPIATFPLTSKSKDCLAWNHDNVSEWSDIYTAEISFQ